MLCGDSGLVCVLLEHVLADELDWVFWSLLCQLFKGLDELGHDVGIQVLADGQVGVNGVLGSFGVTVLSEGSSWI